MSFNFYKRLSSFLLVSTALLCQDATAQTNLFSEDFNSGNGQFTINTTDVNSTAIGDNKFIVNNSYTGGNGTFQCDLGILVLPIDYSIANTPQQPAGVTAGPTSNYLHTVSEAALADGLTNCSFLAASSALTCTNAGYSFARMTSDISTVGNSSVDLKFWWICAGGPTFYGEVYYSTNAGSSWTLITSPISSYLNSSTWQEQTISLPEFANQATLRIGFRFVNQPGDVAADPGFGIDDVRLVSSTAVPNSISTAFAASASYCAGSVISIPFTALGSYTGGNVYTVQLSDASGSFSNPTTIGTLNSTAGSGNIPATIPPGTPDGAGYRIRVVASSPTTTGTQNSTAFAVGGSAGLIPLSSNPPNITSLCGGPITFTIPSGYTSVVWSTGATAVNSITVSTPGEIYVSGLSGTCQAFSDTVNVVQNENPVAGFTYMQTAPGVYEVVFTNTSTNASGYVWDFGNGFTTTAANPEFTFNNEGNYPIRLIATNACGSDTIDIVIEIIKVGINDIFWNLDLNIHPNPFSNAFRIETNLGKPEQLEISIVNILGKVVRKDAFTAAGKSTRIVDLSGEAAGVYFVIVKGETGSLSRKVVKN